MAVPSHLGLTNFPLGRPTLFGQWNCFKEKSFVHISTYRNYNEDINNGLKKTLGKSPASPLWFLWPTNKHTWSWHPRGGGMFYGGTKWELRPLTGGMENPGIRGVLEQEPSSRWCPKQIAGNRRAVSMLNYQPSSALMREYPIFVKACLESVNLKGIYVYNI